MSLFGLLSATAGFVKVRFLIDKEVIDNAVFRFHYRVTSAVLFVCCILCTANSLIGNPIECLNEAFKDKINVINTFCWITSTFTLPHEPSQIVGRHVAAHGLGNHFITKQPTHHNYYQWVPFVLFLQGIMFYLPHWFWKNWEERKIRQITEGMRGSSVDTKEDRKERTNKVVTYLMDSLHIHNAYAFGYFLCEILNFVNVVGNIFFLDKFLGHAFLTYGTKVLEYSNQDQVNRTDPMIAIFPRLTKCVFQKFGPSGSIELHDALCVLPLNILNEKIFIFLWFWFIILAVMSGLALLYSLVIVAYPPIRKVILEKRFKYKVPLGVSTIVAKTKVGDFLLLHLLGQNMTTTVFRDVLEEFSSKLNDYKNLSTPTAMEMKPIYPKLDGST
ncbi:innexin inx3-like [Periplaneta americana]|uniref:Innexin n=1 Tax=Periplaneta americana TaxID=6978 RepID=A0ABQ8T316_PERAM|nr:hypothetical protein ANN_08436 [Periplaneta americana]